MRHRLCTHWSPILRVGLIRLCHQLESTSSHLGAPKHIRLRRGIAVGEQMSNLWSWLADVLESVCFVFPGDAIVFRSLIL